MIEPVRNQGVAPVREVTRAERTRVSTQRPSDSVSISVPATPPAEVLNALDEGARVMRELSEARVELHFAVEQGNAGKRVRIEVREADGNLVREIPARKLLDILAGDSRGLAVDALG
jgi:flagellar protein FlaG